MLPIDQGGLNHSLGNYIMGQLGQNRNIDFAVDDFMFSVGASINVGSVVQAYKMDQLTQKRLETWTVTVKSTFTSSDYSFKYGAHVAVGDLLFITDRNSAYEPLVMVKKATSWELWKYWEYAATNGSLTERLNRLRVCPFQPTNGNKNISITASTTGNAILSCNEPIFPAGFDRGMVRIVTDNGTGEESLYLVTGYISDTRVNCEHITGNIIPAFGYTVWAISSWGNGDVGWPSLCSFYENRLMFASSIVQPDTIWNSNLDNLFLMLTPRTTLDQGIGYFGAVQASDAFDITPSVGQVSKMRWLVVERNITCGTGRSEFIIKGLDGSYSATNSTVSSPTGFGAGNQSIGFRAQDATFFVEKGNKAIRELAFSEENGGYTSRLISILGPDMASVDSVAYSFDNSRIYIADGSTDIYVCTLERGAGVLAWSTLEMPRAVSTVAIVEDGAGTQILVVTDTDHQVSLLTVHDEDSSLTDSHTLCGVDKAQNFSILDTPTHYTFPAGYAADGDEVFYITDDGQTGTETIVTAGGFPAILKPSGSTYVTVYKSALHSRIVTLPYLAGSLFGEPQIALKRFDQALFRIHKGLKGVKIGTTDESLFDLEFDSAQGVFTGPVVQNLSGSPERDHSVILDNKTVSPYNLLSISVRGMTDEG